MDYVKEILKEETKGLSLNKERKNGLIFSYNDVEEMLRELESRLKNKKPKRIYGRSY